MKAFLVYDMTDNDRLEEVCYKENGVLVRHLMMSDGTVKVERDLGKDFKWVDDTVPPFWGRRFVEAKDIGELVSCLGKSVDGLRHLPNAKTAFVSHPHHDSPYDYEE